MVKITQTDRGYNALMRRLERASRGRVVAVGVLGKEADARHGGSSTVEVATVHEFGAPGAEIPERSFIRATVDDKKAEIQGLQRKLAQGVLLGRVEPDQALGIIGEKVVQDIQARILSNIPPALQPETIARKGSSTALIDSGQLLQSVTYQVRPAA